MLRKILLATAIAGVLDLTLAAALTLIRGKDVSAMLRFVASGPFPPAQEWGALGALAGVAVHFGLMAIMAVVYVLAWANLDRLRRRPVTWGLIYGFMTFVVLDLIVVPLRFPAAWPPKPVSVATQLFAHLILVGLVFALVVSQGTRSRTIGQH